MQDGFQNASEPGCISVPLKTPRISYELEVADSMPLPAAQPRSRLTRWKYRQRKPRQPVIDLDEIHRSADEAALQAALTSHATDTGCQPLDSYAAEDELPGVSTIYYRQEMEWMHAKLTANRPYLIDQYVTFRATGAALQRKIQDVVIQTYEAAVSNAADRHKGCSGHVSSSSTQSVRVHFMWDTGWLRCP